jgi:quercetin dioxygenase-like cupin family protein
MSSKRNMLALVLFMLFSFVCGSTVCAAEPASAFVKGYDEVLKASPRVPAEKVQPSKVGGDETTTLFVTRVAPGAEVKPHFHKTHSETLYFIEGTGQMILDGKVNEVKPGSIHFNPMTKVHALKNTGKDEMVIFQIFTPVLTAPDRVLVP